MSASFKKICFTKKRSISIILGCKQTAVSTSINYPICMGCSLDIKNSPDNSLWVYWGNAVNKENPYFKFNNLFVWRLSMLASSNNASM